MVCLTHKISDTLLRPRTSRLSARIARRPIEPPLRSSSLLRSSCETVNSVPSGASFPLLLQLLFPQLLQLLQFEVVRAVELVDLAVAERPAPRRRFPRLLEHLWILDGHFDDQVVHRRTRVALGHAQGIAVEPAVRLDVGSLIE